MQVAIVHYAEELPTDPGFISGRYASIAKALVDRGHDPVRIAPTFSHKRKTMRRLPIVSHDGLPVSVHLIDTPSYTSHRSLARIRHLRAFVDGARRAIRTLRPDAVLIGFPPVGILSSKLTGAMEVPPTQVVDVRDLWPDAQLTTSRGITHFALALSSPLIHRQVRRDMNAAHGIVAISEDYAAWGLRHRSTATHVRSLVAPLGTRMPPTSTPAGTSERSGVIFAGSLTQHFSFTSLLRAWRILTEVRPELTARHPLTIFGDGPERTKIEARAVAIPNIRVVGRVPHSDALEAMETAAIAVAPYGATATMGLPNKLFEYLGAGAPIVSTLHGEMERFLREHEVGTTVDEHDARRYAEALISWLDDEDRRGHAGRQGHALIRDSYNHDALGAGIADFLVDVHEQRLTRRS